jgi:hypothetical protein
MDDLTQSSSEIVDGLRYLIPGFISVLVFRSFTARTYNSTFESIMLALIFTFSAGLLAALVSPLLLWAGEYLSLGVLTRDGQTAIAAIFAAILGIIASTLANRDSIHRLARSLRLTNETSYPSQWYSSFRHRSQYVTLHLKDGRRIYGWPEEWPSQSDRGHFLVSEITWLEPDGASVQSPQSSLLVCANDVEFVEFVK